MLVSDCIEGDDEDSNEEEEMDSDEDLSASDDDEEEEGDMLPIEKAARKQRARDKRDQGQAEQELQMNIKETEVYKLPSGQDVAKDGNLAPDLEVLKQRIRDIMQVCASATSSRRLTVSSD